jgi:hypothetical protein
MQPIKMKRENVFYVRFRHIVNGEIFTLPIVAGSLNEAHKKALDYPYENNWYEIIREDMCKGGEQ